jgi:ABC-type transport system involved in multi-copper enzyme maturation permease subunit
MFAALAIERDPFSWANVPFWLVSFFQDAGGFAAFGLALWLLWYVIRRLSHPGARVMPFDPFGGFLNLNAPDVRAGALDRLLAQLAPWLRRLFGLLVVITALAYGVLGVLKLPEFLGWAGATFTGESYKAPELSRPMQEFIGSGLTTAGLIAICTVLLPFLVDLLRLRWGRIFALAQLTVLEVVRRRVLWIFLLLALVFLFGTWFIDSKPENQVRSYVEVVYLAMAVLLLLTGSLLASFSIPTDIRQQTIHTIVTKPVERYELFLGRFLGYSAVLTVALVVMACFSLLYVFRGVDPDAAAESLKARVPLYGSLVFEGTPDVEKGENVGMEWEYRGYIAGPMGTAAPPQYAIWSLADLPADLAQRDKVTCEYTFAIYRTTIGELNKGVFCSFTATSWLWDPARRGELEAERKRLKDEQKKADKPLSDEQINDQLAEKYGIYELPSKEVTNYHTQAFDLPGGLFRNYFRPRAEVAGEAKQLQDKQANQGLTVTESQRLALLERVTRGEAPPPLLVRVRCISRTQFVGMARYDLYLLDRERSFAANFFKGAAGIWFLMELGITLALACGTYLSGVVSWICVVFLFVLGLFRDFVQTVSIGKNEGGGPAEAMLRLLGRTNTANPLDPSTVTSVATGSDEVYRWVLRRFINVLPDVDRFDFGNFVASGFNVSGATLTVTLLFLFGYLLLWLVAAYYLIKAREIAIPS